MCSWARFLSRSKTGRYLGGLQLILKRAPSSGRMAQTSHRNRCTGGSRRAIRVDTEIALVRQNEELIALLAERSRKNLYPPTGARATRLGISRPQPCDDQRRPLIAT